MSVRHLRLVVLLLVTSCVRSSGTEVRPPLPAPQPDPPITSETEAPWSFRFAEGAHRLELNGTAVIEAIDSSRVDSMHTTIRLTYRFAHEDPGVIRATVDSFALTSSQNQSVHPDGVPVSFEMRFDSLGRLASPGTAAPAACSSPTGALAAIGRELLPVLPVTFDSGTRWSDTLTSVTCRGEIPLLTRTIRHHVVHGLVNSGGRAVLRVGRTSSTELTGSSGGQAQLTTVTGTGASRGEFLFDLSSGHLVEGHLESVLEVSFDAASRRERFRQTAVHSLRPVPDR